MVKLKNLLSMARIKRYEANLKPMTKEELIERAKISEQEIKLGRVTSIEDLEKEIEN